MKGYINENIGSDLNFFNPVTLWKLFFCILFIMGTIAAIAGGVIAKNTQSIGYVLIGIGFAITGLSLILFPFAAPEIFEAFDNKSSKIIVRVLGVLIIILGLVFILFQKA